MIEKFRSKALMNVLASFTLGVVVALVFPTVGYALAAGSTVAIIFIYRSLRQAQHKVKKHGT